MKAGFLSGGSQKRAPASKKAEPKIEDVTHIKAKDKNEQLKMDEV